MASSLAHLRRYALLMVSLCIREASDTSKWPSGIVSAMEAEVRNLNFSLESCNRLKNTPIPLAYVIHLRSFLVLWLAVLPFVFAPEMHWFAIGVCMVIGYQLLGFEEIGIEIENPFGTTDVRCLRLTLVYMLHDKQTLLLASHLGLHLKTCTLFPQSVIHRYTLLSCLWDFVFEGGNIFSFAYLNTEVVWSATE